MGGLLQRLKADAFLGYRAVIAHPLKKLFSTDARTGEEKFLANYAAEALVAMRPDERRALQGAARCIHCGLCDAYDPALSTLPRTIYDGASLLAVAYSRATPDLLRARAALSRLDDASLTRAEAVCPTRVPLAGIAAYLRGKLEQIRQAQSPPA